MMGKEKIITKLGQFFKRHIDFIICLLIVSLLLFGISRIYTIVLVSADDAIFQNILSGGMSGTPDAHCYFIRYPLAIVLSVLYKIVKGIAWYQLFLFLALAWSLFLITSRMHLLKFQNKILYLSIVTLTIMLLFTTHIVNLEWTITAGILGMTSVFRYITMPLDIPALSRIKEYLICAILLVLSFCIRNTVAYMFIPLMGIFWVKRFFELYSEKSKNGTLESKKRFRDNIIFLAAGLTVLAVVMLIHTLAYRDEEWKEYKEYTADRAILFDYYGYPSYDKYQSEYESAGISKETYDLMMMDYNYIVSCDNFENIDLKPIADIAEDIYGNSFTVRIKKMVKILLGVLRNPDYLAVHVIILLLFFCNCVICRKGKVIDLAFLGMILAWAILMSSYLAFKGRLPERVVRCIYYGLIGALSGNIFNYILKKKEKETLSANILNIFCCVVIACMVMVGSRSLYRDNLKDTKLARSKMQILEYCENNPANEYLRDFWSFSQRGEIFMTRGYEADNYLSTGGWAYKTPIYNESLKTRGCENFSTAVNDNQNIYYLVNKNRAQGVVNRLNAYFSSQGQSIRMEEVDDFRTESETVIVLKFSIYQE